MHPAPKVHDFPAGCMDFVGCAPGMYMNYTENFVPDTHIGPKLKDRVHEKNPYFRHCIMDCISHLTRHSVVSIGMAPNILRYSGVVMAYHIAGFK